MLNCHGNHGSTSGSDADCLWFDLVDPDRAERERVEIVLGASLPDRASLGSVELSSRARLDGDLLRLHVPWYGHDGAAPAPLGLLVSPQHLVSLRYGAAAEFDAAARVVDAATPDSSAAAFTLLVQEIVGRVADQLEDLAADIDRLSTRLFERHRHGTRRLRSILGRVGRTESRLSRARLTASGTLRIIMFVHDNAPAWIDHHALTRLRTVQKDFEILAELDSQLTSKLQFLQDAALGFINVEQNDVMKIFTVASVAAIPPVILVGIWGMNFHHMPELGSFYGYPAALLLIVCSIIAPMLWFKRRGWF